MVRRKDGLWQEQLKMKGDTKYTYFYGKTKAEVMRKIVAFKDRRSGNARFQQVADEWWELHEPTLANNSLKSYRPARARAIERFGSVRIADIDPPTINSFVIAFSKIHADKTVRMQLLVLNLIFKYAVQNGYIRTNPAREIVVPRGLPKQKITSPGSDDIARVKQSVKCTFGLFAYFAMYTGMRRGELLALTWKDVDVENRTITIDKSLEQVNNKPQIKPPKTKSSIRTVPIMDALYRVLKPKKSGLVFANSNGQHITETQFQRLWELYCNESGVTSTPHQFRHAYATMLFENDIPPTEAQALLGHAQLSTTMDIYTDLREQKQRAIFEKVRSIDIA